MRELNHDGLGFDRVVDFGSWFWIDRSPGMVWLGSRLFCVLMEHITHFCACSFGPRIELGKIRVVLHCNGYKIRWLFEL